MLESRGPPTLHHFNRPGIGDQDVSRVSIICTCTHGIEILHDYPFALRTFTPHIKALCSPVLDHDPDQCPILEKTDMSIRQHHFVRSISLHYPIPSVFHQTTPRACRWSIYSSVRDPRPRHGSISSAKTKSDETHGCTALRCQLYPANNHIWTPFTCCRIGGVFHWSTRAGARQHNAGVKLHFTHPCS